MMWLVSVALAAELPELNAQVLHISPDGRAGVALDDALLPRERQVFGRAWVHYVNRPLVAVYTDGTEVAALSDVLAVNLLSGISFGRLQVDAHIPLYLSTWGDAIEAQPLLGDIEVGAKFVALDPETNPLGLAPVVRFALPVAGEVAPLGSRGFDGSFGAAASKDLGPWLLAANLGVRVLPEVELENATWGSQFFVRAGGSRQIGERAGASLELSAAAGLAETAGDAAANPVELLAGGWYRATDRLVVRAGAGTGLTRGIGAPSARVLVGVGWEPPTERDRDGDGLRDRADGCVSSPEDVDGFSDIDGCPDPDNDDDKRLDTDDACPMVAEDADGWEDGDGCPDLLTEVTVVVAGVTGKSGEAIRAEIGGFVNHGAEGTTGLAAGDYTLSAEAPGYLGLSKAVVVVNGPPQRFDVTLAPVPAVAPAPAAPAAKAAPAPRVVLTAERIVILEKVFFDTGKATIKKQSFGLLGEVAATLQAHPELTRVRVEGHTDSRGDDQKNLTLSQRRAEAVVAWLVKAGIDPSRLEGRGFGETKPLDPAETSAAWDQNRRVEFIIAPSTP